jgi:hypothetical protein
MALEVFGETAAAADPGESAFDDPAFGRLSGRRFRHNAGRRQLHAPADTLASFMRTPALPKAVAHWSLTTLREKRVRIGAKVVAHGRDVTFRMAEVAGPRDLFRDILRRIDRLRRLVPAMA